MRTTLTSGVVVNLLIAGMDVWLIVAHDSVGGIIGLAANSFLAGVCCTTLFWYHWARNWNA
jgi:hypothetical protein